ncbi:uncharacterized protein MKK02DRAFT_41588 [Dioszegia hungarica]|uniref:Mitochondrial zinc maintenance protein 1, mitochondrial n=1 Tax=Dioszegia hungarica TaxID=4972 RepID=A0AA38LQI8_9TREE|nr:uncharacterized protein MKK02DRAFT_41588 [Dioszegia hungarica]KAI9631950.1 hypothetical protein MKK02DRAFT_41588 [Dioszegia hungarica]
MSLSPTLLTTARSTYRAVLRSARITFAGDLPRRAALENAVRATFRSRTMTPPTPGPSSSSSAPASSSSSSSPASPSHTSSEGGVGEQEVDPALIAQRLAEWGEIASFLRRNVVQGTMDESGSYKLRLTKDTELNDNERDKPAAVQPLTPFPNRDKSAPRPKCGETPPEAPAFW